MRLEQTFAALTVPPPCVLRYSQSGVGPVEPLHGELSGSFRLRVGDYRILFELEGGTMRIFAVRHRSEAYR